MVKQKLSNFYFQGNYFNIFQIHDYCFRGASLSVDHCWQGKSALLCAIDSGSWDLVVSILNRSQIDLNRDYKTENGWTPLIVACRHGHAGLVDLLINRGEDYIH